MKKTILVTSLMLLLAVGPAMAQMMGGGQQMMGGQDAKSSQQMMEQQQMQQTAPTQGQNYPQYMNRGMMGGGYGYGMNPGMMGGGYGYGMNQGMMSGYGQGMMPNMMGTGTHPCMSGYGYGINSGTMGGYGMGPGMMGYYSPEQYEKQFKKHQDFLDETRELRKKLHNLKFDFSEAQRNPDTKREDLKKINAEMESIWEQIYKKKKATFK
ncbi:MAG: hypothetical protein ABFR35_05610 [Thermodesulfobacteriota bacterium]